MILGDVCTRACKYCGVAHGMPTELDEDEPRRVADSVAQMELEHVVITSVNRDELPDGGAWIYAETIRQIHARVPGCSVEVLIPDFKGDEEDLRFTTANFFARGCRILISAAHSLGRRRQRGR